MDPTLAGLWIAASMFTSLRANRSQAKVENASINMEVEQARLQNTEMALERTRQLRQNMATNLALSGIGKGGVSGFRNVATQDMQSYFEDVSALTNRDVFAQISGQARRAGVKTNRLTRDVSSLESAASLATKLGLFEGK